MKHWRERYDYGTNFNDGRAKVKLNNKYGVVDTDGNEVIPLKYDEVDLDGKEYFSREALAILRKHTEGNEVVSLKYDRVGHFYEGRAYVKLSEKYGFVDTEGNEVIPLKYDGVGDFSEGRARVSLNEKYGFVDTEGNEIVPLKYDYAAHFYEGRAWVEVKINGEIIKGEIDLDGREYFSREALAKLRKYRLPNIIDSIS
jgi:hypothetical protein